MALMNISTKPERKLGDNDIKQNCIFFTHACACIHAHKIPVHINVSIYSQLDLTEPNVSSPPHVSIVSLMIPAFNVITATGKAPVTADVSGAESFPPSLHVFKVVVGTSNSPVSVAEYE